MQYTEPPHPAARPWLQDVSQARELEILDAVAGLSTAGTADRIAALIARHHAIHDDECVNLNPATNIMNPRAEAVLASGLGTRPSLGHPGAKYEMGLEAVEEIEVIAARLACQVFGARFAELRVASGAMANLTAFMATCRPGDAIIVPPGEIGGHVTHRRSGAADLYGLAIHECPIDAEHFTVDLDALAVLARAVRPKLITIGGSLNLLPHPVRGIKAVADGVGATVLFDAAHASGMIAGRVWPNPLDEGADLMTMSTYKSLGGPAGGLIVTNRADLAERLDAIAYPGLTANFDVARTAALALSLLDWIDDGGAYAQAMVSTAIALAEGLDERGIPVHRAAGRFTTSHQFAVVATEWGGGHEAALRLRRANILASAIGLPGLNEWAGLRLGTPEIVRWGMTPADMPELAELVVAGLRADPVSVAPRTTAFRRRFRTAWAARG